MKRRTEIKKDPAAVALGRKAAGIPKKFSRVEIARRRAQMVEINNRRRKA
jgi:hypothetical protein